MSVSLDALLQDAKQDQSFGIQTEFAGSHLTIDTLSVVDCHWTLGRILVDASGRDGQCRPAL